MAARFCTNCGSPVEAAAGFCGNCGTRIAPVAAPPPVVAPPPAPSSYAPPSYGPPPPAVPPPGYPYAAPPYPAAPYPAYDYAAAERKKRIDRTRTGVLLIAIGFVLNWVPYTWLPGSVLILVGAILGILGRKAFGERHSQFVVVAIIVFFIGIIAAGALAAIFTFQFLVAVSLGNLASAGAAVRNFVIALIAAAAISGIASVLFVHELENKTGKYLLYAGYAAGVIAPGIVAALAISQIESMVASGSASGLESLFGELTTLGLLSGVSSILFAGAYFIAYSRIQRREIPPSVAPPTPVPGWPPATPSPSPPTVPPPATPPPAAPSAPTEPVSPMNPSENPPPGPEEL